jgi:hypothetical protein
MRETDDTEEADNQCQRRKSDSEGGTGDCRRRDTRRKEKPTAPSEWTKLRGEAKAIPVVSDAHARNHWKSNADVVAVWHNHIIQVLELFPESKELGIKCGRGKCGKPFVH